MNGYELLVWIKDESGREFYCDANSVRPDFRDGDRLNDEEREACSNVNAIVGTERW